MAEIIQTRMRRGNNVIHPETDADQVIVNNNQEHNKLSDVLEHQVYVGSDTTSAPYGKCILFEVEDNQE